MIPDLPFREVWAVDFEFAAPDGERPKPICLVARELRMGRLVRQWEDEWPAASLLDRSRLAVRRLLCFRRVRLSLGSELADA